LRVEQVEERQKTGHFFEEPYRAESPENSQSDALSTNHNGATQPDATVDVNKEKFQAFVAGTHKTSGNTALMEMSSEALCIISQHVSGENTFRA